MSPGRLSRTAWRVLLILAAACNARADRDVVRTFSENASSQFNHLSVDRNTGRVYVGAVNRIYQLSPELELEQSVVTGPANDSQSASDIPTKPTDNTNKALVIDYAANRLITCWSVEGRCSVRNLSNISRDVREAPECVVSDSAASSTVAFVASGPTTKQVLYVGVTETGNSPCGFGIPAVSSRSLEDNRLFMIDRSRVRTGTRMFVNSLVRERYPINYVHGFSSEGFSYFLTTQLRGVNSDTYYSKLVRVCHDDENYYSYTEIPISCKGGSDIDYNLVQAAFVGKSGSVLAGELGINTQHDVLFAAFSQSQSTNSNKPSNLSALCVYSLKAIRRKFTENIKTCFSGNGSRGLDFISPADACRRTEIESIDDDFCGSDVNTPLGGEQAVEAAPLIVFEKRLTAVAATVAGEYTVVIAGTVEGHLKKIVVENATLAIEYGDIVVDEGSAVNKDLFIDSQSLHLYAMTERKVFKVKVQECSAYKSCSTCLGAEDPYCGWCSHENKCSLRSDCQDAATDLYWLSYRSEHCTIMTQVTPNQLQRTTTRTLNLVIENLPTLNGQLLCAFTAFDRTLITNATRKSDGVNCPTPSTDTLPPIPAGQNHFTAQLSVRTTQGLDVVATKFTIFDCNTLSSCTECVSSSFPCDWCVDGHRCTHDTAENCRNDILVTGVTRIGPSYRAGSNFCPSIKAASDGSNEILVPFGVKKAIKVKVNIVGQFIVQTRFVCRFDIEGRVTHVNTQLLADTIYCDAMEFTYTSRAPNMTASLAVVWGGSKPLDNPDDTHILIYRCKEMADSCDTCLALSEKFGCGWCRESGRCEAREQCSLPSAWLNGTQTCPNTTEISKNVTSFDCNAFSSCTRCVSASFPCDWCVDGHRCTHDTAENCRNDILVTGITRISPSYRVGPKFCPSIKAASDGSNEILVPFGIKKTIRVKVNIIGQFIVQTRFVCQFDIEGRVTHVNAQLLADTIYCDTMEFTYTSLAPKMTASLAVIWGGSKQLDNPDGTHILIYRCEEMAESCDTCLALSERFGCGWCQESRRCEARKQCGVPSAWLNGTQTCPNTTEIHSKNVTSLDCNTFSSCTECVSSSFPCDWCVDGHRCTHDTAENCRNDILVNGVTRIGPSYRAGPNFCPSIKAASDGSNEILVPFGVKKAIKVKVNIVGQFIVQTRFVCRFDIEGRVTHVNAQLLADTIYCDAMEFTYTSRAPNMTASLAVVWGGSKPLDNPDDTHILIYCCEEMADSCDTCLALSERFGCGWCRESGRCEAREQCGVPSAWLNGTQTCPNTTEISKNVTSFDCNAFSSCTRCVSASFPCDWCVNGHRCTHDTAENCRNDILVTGITRISPSYRVGPKFCPSIKAASDGSNEILVPFGIKKTIRVKVNIIGQFIVQTRFVCQFDIEGRVTHVNAQLLADTIYCDTMEFTYTSLAPKMTASLAVIWGGSKQLDNPDGTHILIYRCEEMAESCDTCLALSERFGCGWCQESRRCEARKQCGVPSAWLNGTQTCPNTTEIHSKNVTSLDCNTFSSCTECVSSSFPCDWCVDGHRCTHDTAENCRNDILVNGVTRIGPSYRAGPNFCPSIKAASDGSNEILVPFGVKKAIKVKVNIVGQFIVQTRFVCRFDIEGRVTHVNAQLLADTIYCDAMEFTYTSRAPNMTASLAVVWGGSKPLDNPDDTHILIYRCEEMADSCDTCLALSERFGCGWCRESGRCEAREQCGVPSAWLNGTQTCPNTTEIHSKNVTSFDCNTFSSCTECVSSSFPCDWCVDGHWCTHDTAENCRNDILVTGVTRIGPRYRAGPNFCPSIKAASDGSNEILVPFGVKKAIKVKVNIVGQFIVQTRFVCRFNIEGRVTNVNAQLLADTIYCDATEFTYTSRAPKMTASLAVIWGGSKPLDNPDDTHILIYRCEEMADSCDTCLALSERFGCGWCRESGLCEAREQCGVPSAWLNGTQTCPNTTEIHSKNVTSFDCNTFSSCTECVSSSFPCDWCVDGHRCTHDTAENCRNDILVTGVTRIGPSYRAGPNFCPSIKAASDGSNEILVPFGVKKAIKVKVNIVGQFIVQTRFVCRFDIEGRVTHVNAQLLADTIYCDATEFTYTSRAPNMTASLSVVWGGSKPLDNPDDTHILIYRCEEMAHSCDTCLALLEKFGCGWCRESGRCEAREQCSVPSAWLNGTQTCPTAEINSAVSSKGN